MAYKVFEMPRRLPVASFLEALGTLETHMIGISPRVSAREAAQKKLHMSKPSTCGSGENGPPNNSNWEKKWSKLELLVPT